MGRNINIKQHSFGECWKCDLIVRDMKHLCHIRRFWRKIKIQNIISPSTENCTEEALYFRRFGDVEYSLAQENIMLKKEAIGFF